MSTKTQTKYDAVILGAGVLGLSIAQELTKRGWKVAIVARDLPEDVDSASFASPWAGANWASYATNDREKKWDTTTFERLGQLALELPDIVRLTNVVYTYQHKEDYIEPWYKDVVKDYHHLSGDEIPKGWKYAYGFRNYCLNPPAYLAHLSSSLKTSGVPIIRARVSSLDEAYSICGFQVQLVINATALGSKSLIGVEDDKVFPARGQTVLVKAPKVITCMATKSRDRLQSTGTQTYIIPRPGPDGHVILGGTFEKGNYSCLPDTIQAERMLKEAWAICPDLSNGSTWEQIEVVSHNVGLRPCREGGARVELELRKIGENKRGLVPTGGEREIQGEGKEVGVVHAYGIGPAGYQASIGIAVEASDLAEQYLSRIKDKAKL